MDLQIPGTPIRSRTEYISTPQREANKLKLRRSLGEVGYEDPSILVRSLVAERDTALASLKTMQSKLLFYQSSTNQTDAIQAQSDSLFTENQSLIKATGIAAQKHLVLQANSETLRTALDTALLQSQSLQRDLAVLEGERGIAVRRSERLEREVGELGRVLLKLRGGQEKERGRLMYRSMSPVRNTVAIGSVNQLFKSRLGNGFNECEDIESDCNDSEVQSEVRDDSDRESIHNGQMYHNLTTANATITELEQRIGSLESQLSINNGQHTEECGELEKCLAEAQTRVNDLEEQIIDLENNQHQDIDQSFVVDGDLTGFASGLGINMFDAFRANDESALNILDTEFVDGWTQTEVNVIVAVEAKMVASGSNDTLTDQPLLISKEVEVTTISPVHSEPSFYINDGFYCALNPEEVIILSRLNQSQRSNALLKRFVAFSDKAVECMNKDKEQVMRSLASMMNGSYVSTSDNALIYSF